MIRTEEVALHTGYMVLRRNTRAMEDSSVVSKTLARQMMADPYVMYIGEETGWFCMLAQGQTVQPQLISCW